MTDIARFPTRVLRAHNRYDQAVALQREQQDDVIAELESATDEAGLPQVRWHLDPRWGFTGAAEGGTALHVEHVVARWAEAFFVKMLVVQPEGHADGFASVHLPSRGMGVGVTIAGRLIGVNW